MKKGETLFQRVVFRFVYLVAMFVPPFASLKRLEPVCRFRLSKNPNAYTPRKGLAVAYNVGEKYSQAKTEYTYLDQLGYLTDKDVVNFAEVLYKLEEYQEVVALLLPISKQYPTGYRTNRYLGLAYMKLGMCDKAIVYLEYLLKFRVPTYEDLWHLGHCYSELKRYDEALDTYMKAFQSRPDVPQPELRENIAYLHCKRGQIFLESDINSSEREFTKALEFWPQNQEALDGLASLRDTDTLRS